MKPRVIVIIQGRMGSSRLPGKVLLDIAGQPMLERVFRRASRAGAVDAVIIATSTDPSDDAVVEHCRSKNIPCERGSLYDVLDRFYQTSRNSRADMTVRLTADCPVIDPILIDAVVNTLKQFNFDFACNRLPPPNQRTYPIGLDVEACTFKALERAWQESSEPYLREHVMPYLYEGVKLTKDNPELQTGISRRGFKVALLDHSKDYGSYRWTVDTSKDLEFIRQVYSHFNGRDDFSWREVLALVHGDPVLMAINATVHHKTMKDIDARTTTD